MLECGCCMINSPRCCISMAVRRQVRYSPLPAEDVDDGRDLRYEFTPKALERVPWRSIALAVFLLLMGSALLLLALFVFAGHLEADLSQGFGLMVVGVLAFLPGFYETRIAYYSWRGVPGYKFTAIPDY